jgi:hypothetical protein
MLVSLQPRRGNRRRRPRGVIRLHLEALEVRSLPSCTTWPGFLHPVCEVEPNDTLDKAQELGNLSTKPPAEVVGTIGNGTAGAADQDFYKFELDRASNVNLMTLNPPGVKQPVTTLSLYNSDPNDANDPYDPLGNRLLAQDDTAAHAGFAHINRLLAPGTYYVAVSGSGNHYFHPLLAGSGIPGNAGDYALLITASDLHVSSGDGPMVLTTDPAAATALDRSPFMIRIDLSGTLDPSTVVAGGSVQLLTNAKGTFGNGNDQPVALSGANFSSAANELQVAPAAPLASGFYKVVLAGDSSTGQQVLADLKGTPLGKNSKHPTGADFTYTFQITGNEGIIGANSPADDTPAAARQLGDVTKAGLVQVAGAIGTDATDPVPFDPNNVEFYHFQIKGPGRYALLAEVFAGRIGSPLDPGVSLFQVGPGGKQLHLLAANDNTLNGAKAGNGTLPLYTDSALSAGLQEGDYYLAVSSTGNVPDPVNGLLPGTNGIFDPNVSHSGQNGFSTGNYVLNLQVQADNQPPRVVSATLPEGATLAAPPTSLAVQFSKLVNLQQLTYQAFQQSGRNTLSAV